MNCNDGEHILAGRTQGDAFTMCGMPGNKESQSFCLDKGTKLFKERTLYTNMCRAMFSLRDSMQAGRGPAHVDPSSWVMASSLLYCLSNPGVRIGH